MKPSAMLAANRLPQFEPGVFIVKKINMKNKRAF